MEELVKMIKSKTGISEEKAEAAVNTVLSYIKDKLPNPVASQVEGVIKGSGGIEGAVKGFDGVFGE